MAKLGKVVCVDVLIVSLDITSTSSASQPTSPPPRGLYVQEGGTRALRSHSLTWALGLLHRSHPKSIQLHSLKLMSIELLLSIVVALKMLQVELISLSVTVDTTVVGGGGEQQPARPRIQPSPLRKFSHWSRDDLEASPQVLLHSLSVAAWGVMLRRVPKPNLSSAVKSNMHGRKPDD